MVTTMGTLRSADSEILSEASCLVRRWAGQRGDSDSVKCLIRRAARRLGFTYSRTKALWYREAKAIRADEMDALRRREKAGNAGDDFTALRRRLERLERHLNLMDEAAAGAVASEGRGMVRQARRATVGGL